MFQWLKSKIWRKRIQKQPSTYFQGVECVVKEDEMSEIDEEGQLVTYTAKMIIPKNPKDFDILKDYFHSLVNKFRRDETED